MFFKFYILIYRSFGQPPRLSYNMRSTNLKEANKQDYIAFSSSWSESYPRSVPNSFHRACSGENTPTHDARPGHPIFDERQQRYVFAEDDFEFSPTIKPIAPPSWNTEIEYTQDVAKSAELYPKTREGLFQSELSTKKTPQSCNLYSSEADVSLCRVSLSLYHKICYLKCMFMLLLVGMGSIIFFSLFQYFSFI